ncbi:MAG: protein translocase subunit SecD [Bacteroidetes bacterium]|jgi:SecD/SecF fusion protein|nr:protein translocase subunit SecD [Bacteroidota bacterium]
MKNNRSVIVFSVVLAIACLFQLSFTWKAQSFETKAQQFAEKQQKKGLNYGKAYRGYIDSLGSREVIYDLGIASYNYFECKQREINLGLDLRGGMNVILEVDKGAIIKGMANDPADADLLKAVEQANTDEKNKGGDYVDNFMSAFAKIAPNRKIANLFAKSNNPNGIQTSSNEADVRRVLSAETGTAIDRVYDVVEKRINQANVTQPTIQKIDGGRISVELPGVDNPRRLEDLVEKSANLEFYEVYGNTRKGAEANKMLEMLFKAGKQSALAATADSGQAKLDSAKTQKDSAVAANQSKDDGPLAKLLRRLKGYTYFVGMGSTVASVRGADRDALIEELKKPQYAAVMDGVMKVAFSAKPIDLNELGASLKRDDKKTESSAKKILEEYNDQHFVYLLKLDRDGKAALASEEENIISDARSQTNQTGEVEVSMEMTPQAASRWAQITGANIDKHIAIVLDDRVYSAPVVNQKISGGQSQISGNFDIKEADDLANVLKAGKLPAPARIVASDVVGPSLGEESISRGTSSLLVGFVAILLFMVMYYNRAGVYSIIAVFANMFLIFGILASLGASLTLPGMAGIVLTIGMAVDANVLIYERIKEELRQKISLAQAVKNGYKYALSAIIDSNLTTLLAGIALLMAGSGPAYGFAVIFVIGVFTSMYTSLLVTRWMLENRVNRKKDLKFSFPYSENVLNNTNFDFVKYRRRAYVLSLPIILFGIGAFIYKGGLTTGIDFKGGNAFIIQFDKSKDVSVGKIKETLDKAFPGSSNEAKTFGKEGQFRVITTHRLNENSKEARNKTTEEVISALKNYGVTAESIKGTSKVGSSVAASTRNKSTVLLIVAIFLMFAYILLRFRSAAYGLGATIALIHDVVFILACYSIMDGWVPFPVEFDQHLIAALLTVIGYSMNDTVIVFDRIREFLSGNSRVEKDDHKLINMAINQTLSRTLITSATVFFVCIILFLFGGDALKGFSLALVLGIIVGTYSSIFIATPVVVDFGLKKNKSIKKA